MVSEAVGAAEIQQATYDEEAWNSFVEEVNNFANEDIATVPSEIVNANESTKEETQLELFIKAIGNFGSTSDGKKGDIFSHHPVPPMEPEHY